MASDLSNFLKDELSNTLEQLLSKSTAIDTVSKVDLDEIEDSQCIEISVKFEFSSISSTWNFFIPSLTATKFEFFMLGGMGDLKEHIDDEIADAVNEIISNVCGSFCTTVNAQGFNDVSSIKSELAGSSIKAIKDIDSSENLFYFDLSLDGEKLPIYLGLDEIILPYLSAITGYEDVDSSSSSQASTSSSSNPSAVSSNLGSSVSSISSLLSEDSAENLQLLFNIRLKLSVRLGTKNFLLKDILRWDIGEIIELEQMVNEPLDILVNGVKIGEGEAVIVEGKFGLKIKNIGDSASRISQIGLS
ncbi:flagellar motor switch protein FliY [Halarcobacter mediterraneus]|uniref:Flagellar motor switch protein FliN n=1 Tax=Halarcobacter mediterraneus TaxID=2023153 RepID=A0A4V1M122_9BACT|nr:FliM/FliN family flagellar motor switch protein [Halarcobacter mediterraneus]RXK11883.1 flagellar motor switch protein FliY [Halarcobacter mediterraneus]